jgi:predicted ATP-grasp superfamily ATP-dependent carboligase
MQSARQTTGRTISILFSEGSSLSARQTLSALGPLGYTIDVCDPNPFCLSRCSRFLRRFYRSPALGANPVAYLRFILGRLKKGRYDVLLPVHEQAFLFARMQHTLASQVGIAVPAFDSLALLQSKGTFARVFTDLGMPQPATRLIRHRAELEAESAFPYYVKQPYGTAGQGVWRVENAEQRSTAIKELVNRGYLDGMSEIVVQSFATGIQCQAQGIFEHGSLIALHCTSQRSVGVGGSQSARLSVDHPVARAHMIQLGQHLSWHGALAVDYFFEPATNQPCYIEANPRLVEPMNAVLSGVNLADILVRLSLGESFKDAGVRSGQAGIRSHSLLATLLGLAADHTRTRLAHEVMQSIARQGEYAESYEDLTPLRLDIFSIVPLAVVIVGLLLDPGIAKRLSSQTVVDYSLTPKAVQTICKLEDRQGLPIDAASRGLSR